MPNQPVPGVGEVPGCDDGRCDFFELDVFTGEGVYDRSEGQLSARSGTRVGWMRCRHASWLRLSTGEGRTTLRSLF